MSAGQGPLLVAADLAWSNASGLPPQLLVVTYSLDASGLAITLAVSNPGTEPLPASIGGHPAFNWPLQPGLAKTDYALAFSEDEPHPIQRLDGGLLRSVAELSPVHGRRLELTEHLFDADALIFDQLRSDRVRYDVEQGAWVEMSWSGFRELAVWSKPGSASFVCIAPWRGYASPAAFDGEFLAKPGLMHIAPGGERSPLVPDSRRERQRRLIVFPSSAPACAALSFADQIIAKSRAQTRVAAAQRNQEMDNLWAARIMMSSICE